MKKNNIKIVNKSTKERSLDPLKPGINSSLGHLAYGHLAFMSWRELKKKLNEKK